VVFTGALESLTRPQAEALVRELGGKAVSGVSAKTSLLVAGLDPGKSKIEAARKLGIRILDKDEFLALAGQGAQEAPAAAPDQPGQKRLF
jgi:DNA ligase (NAD+)